MSTPLPPPYRLRWVGLFISVLLLIAIFLTTGYAFVLNLSTTSTIARSLVLRVSSSHSATVLRLMIETVTFLLQTLIGISLDATLWSTAASNAGVSFPTFLTLTASHPGGLAYLLRWFWNRRVAGWIIFRYSLSAFMCGC
jgi:hypothetical protein